jgi:hypothetical protein
LQPFRYLHGLDESGKEMSMIDPIAPKLRKRAKATAKDARRGLGIREVLVKNWRMPAVG